MIIAFAENVLFVGPFRTKVPPLTASPSEATYVEEHFTWHERTMRIRTWRLYTPDHKTAVGFLLEPRDGRGILIKGPFPNGLVTASFWRDDLPKEPEAMGPGHAFHFANPLSATEILDYLWWLDNDPHYFDASTAGESDEA